MKLIETSINNFYIIQSDLLKDKRGTFLKTYNKDVFNRMGLETSFSEDYISESKKGVLRGLHFQIPPYSHTKLVNCIHGSILDVVVDLRLNSRTYGKYEKVELHSNQGKILYIPNGLAHGFYSLTDEAIVLYKVSTIYSPEHDSGILWNSVGIPWPNDSPIISERDRQLIEFKKFNSPFK